MSQKKLSELAILSIEKEILKELEYVKFNYSICISKNKTKNRF